MNGRQRTGVGTTPQFVKRLFYEREHGESPPGFSCAMPSPRREGHGSAPAEDHTQPVNRSTLARHPPFELKDQELGRCVASSWLASFARTFKDDLLFASGKR